MANYKQTLFSLIFILKYIFLISGLLMENYILNVKTRNVKNRKSTIIKNYKHFFF